MSEIIEVEDKQTKAYNLDQRIKVYANLAWNNFLESAKALKEMRDTKLYLELGYKTFEEYTVESLKIKERQAYTYISTLEKVGERFLQSNAELGITKLALLSDVPSVDREHLVERNDIAGMTVEQVKELVKENNGRGEQIELLNSDLKAADVEREKLNKAADKKDAEIIKLRQEIEELQKKPTEVAVRELSDDELKALTDKAVSDAVKKADKEFKATKKELTDKHKAGIEKVKTETEKAAENMLSEYKNQFESISQENQVILKRAKELEKQLEVAENSETVKFEFFFEAIQQDILKIFESIGNIREKNAESADKFKQAFIKYLEKINTAIKDC